MSGTGPGAEAEAREYFSAIEAEFIRRRGTPFLLSPKDFGLMRRWKELGIPVEDVLAGVGEAFDRREERKAAGRVNSLSYCEGAVLEAWERGAAARVGKGMPDSEWRGPRLEASLAGLEERVRELGAREPRFLEAAKRAVRSLSSLRSAGKTPEQVEDSLARLDKKLLREIEARLEPAESAALEGEIAARLAPEAERMDPRALRRTAEILKRRRLRALHGVPPLTLLGR
jgi:hypothetical protein